ncbi:matrix extracellular phosphoglycoprotein [Erinaceus europaeus]|uniref:Matrix extracellular phosphoglycoprotein n=1 Tax=Erinaceus europaeus TaxID=9365 RepID=A0ABM3X715_ERIEU|nr:matrix extracellular phosphoglycoprotein [Erinaceus europaeus]
MQVVCLGLLLFTLAWAAPTFQPQIKKTQQDCVGEQKQEEKTTGHAALYHFDKGKSREPEREGNVIQEKQRKILPFGSNEHHQSSKPSSLFENEQTMSDNYQIRSKEHAHGILSADADGGTDGGDLAAGHEENGATLRRAKRHHLRQPETHTESLGGESKPRKTQSQIPTDANYATSPSEDKKNHQRVPTAWNVPIKTQSIPYMEVSPVYLKQLPKVKWVPSDFEGSGHSAPEGRGDDTSPFSGDGQLGEGEATDPGLEDTNTQTEPSGPDVAGTVPLNSGDPPHNELPGQGEDTHTLEGLGTANGNDIMGSTSLGGLPGTGSSRGGADSQNAHRGQVEFHYPSPTEKERRKESSRGAGQTHNEIPKRGQGGSHKGAKHSIGSWAPNQGKEGFPGKGLSHHDPSVETHGRKGHYVPHKQSNSTRNRGSWGSRIPHSNRFSHPRKYDSSESSSSDSWSESEGD